MANAFFALLFIVYLNDFEKCLKASKAGMYADDAQVSLASSSVDELVRKAQHELSNISEWMRLNKLSEYMFIGHPNGANKRTEEEKLKLNGSEMKQMKKTKSLGVIIDQGRNWEDQFKAIKVKIPCFFKNAKKHCFTISTKQCLSCACIESYKIR